MTSHQDKGILEIRYNHLNLPNYNRFNQSAIRTDLNGNNTTIYKNSTYLYRADGVKLKKIHQYFTGRNNGNDVFKTTEYLDGFQYETESIGGRPAPPTTKFVPTAEGYYNFENNKYIYNYTDHLGNIRLSYTKSGSSAAIIEESNFYPYGMKQENNVQSNPAYNYEQSGKEFQKETGWSDFGARMYMADIGRWGVIDPLAETTRRINPYNYALDNPISYVDPDGRKAIAPNGFEILQPLNGALGYMIGGGSAVFGSFEEFLRQGAPIGFSQLGDTGLGGGGGGGSSGTLTIGDLMKDSGITMGDLMDSWMNNNSGPGNPIPFSAGEINQLVSAGLITAATAKIMMGAIALEGAGAGVAAGTATSSATRAWATVLTRTIALGLLLSIKSEEPPSRYYVYVIQGQDDIAKFGITRQSDPANRPQSQISGLNKARADRGPHSWQWLQGPVSKESAFLYEKYYVWEYSQKVGRMPYAQSYPYSDALTRYLEKFIKGK